MLSPRAMVRGIPARAKFAAENWYHKVCMTMDNKNRAWTSWAVIWWCSIVMSCMAGSVNIDMSCPGIVVTSSWTKQRVLVHGHQGWNVRHGLCHIYMIYVYIWVVYSFCLFCCLFIIVTTQFVALYKPCKPKPKPSTYDPPPPPPSRKPPLAEIQRPILRPEPKQQICHQHANTDHFGK